MEYRISTWHYKHRKQFSFVNVFDKALNIAKLLNRENFTPKKTAQKQLSGCVYFEIIAHKKD